MLPPQCWRSCETLRVNKRNDEIGHERDNNNEPDNRCDGVHDLRVSVHKLVDGGGSAKCKDHDHDDQNVQHVGETPLGESNTRCARCPRASSAGAGEHLPSIDVRPAPP